MNRKDMKRGVVEKMIGKLSGAEIIAVIDLQGLPARLLHSIRKQMRGEGEVIIHKTSLMQRAVKRAKKPAVLDYLEGQKALLLSRTEPFKLYKKLRSNPLKVYAKAGQTAPYDIVVPAGETSLPPGPALSELKQAGIDARVAAGKIAIGKDSTVAKKGEKISDLVAKALQKLDIRPFELNVRIPAIMEGELVYKEEVLHIDDAEFAKQVSSAVANAYFLSLEIAYPTKSNIEELVKRAYRNARAIGIERDIMVPELAEELLKKAARQAKAIQSKVPEEQSS